MFILITVCISIFNDTRNTYPAVYIHINIYPYNIITKYLNHGKTVENVEKREYFSMAYNIMFYLFYWLTNRG